MDVLLISNEDVCRSRIAQELLYSFGRGMKITTAGLVDGKSVPASVSAVMSGKGYEISRKKSTHISMYTNQHWDSVITLCKDAEDEVKSLPLQTEHMAHFNFDDPFEETGLDEYEQEEVLSALYETMYRELYEFYRDELSELLMPRCTCGANTFCRCE